MARAYEWVPCSVALASAIASLFEDVAVVSLVVAEVSVEAEVFVVAEAFEVVVSSDSAELSHAKEKSRSVRTNNTVTVRLMMDIANLLLSFKQAFVSPR